MGKLKRELHEFLEYKKNYKFKQKELIEMNNCIYCDGFLLRDVERK